MLCVLSNMLQTHKGTQFPLIPKQIAGVRGFSVWNCLYRTVSHTTL